MKRILIVTAAVVVLAANAWCLIAAWRNRSDPSGGTLELTEREARLVQVPWESTAVLLDLRWDVLSDTPRDRGPPAWLDEAKLAELGFDCTVPLGDPNAKEHYTSLSTVLVFVVLEYGGEAWRQANHDREPKTRLFVVDAGREARRLRDRYADTERYVISRGVVRLSYQEHSYTDGAQLATPRLQGWIESVVPNQVFVPRPFSQRLEGFRHHGPPTPKLPENEPRFAVTVSWGSGYEPWVRGVRRLAQGGTEKKTPPNMAPERGQSKVQ